MLIEPHVLNKPGENYHDFVVTKCQTISELGCVLRELTHVPTGALVMHIGNDDPENLFCLSFKTLPSSSNGAAHILEHTVLCGSKKFPVKDPFFGMNRRSLNTFMNALTGSDFTCYPAASQVEKDFYNLLDVYIDAVFHPQIKHLSFLQEGHRLEFTDPQNSKTPLEYKGIVFNEMKGSLASADARLWHSLLEHLVPDLPYAYNSGGDPKDIPHLTYEELIQFHETYYHPSRCLFFFYGNLPIKQNLDFIAEHALKNVPKQPPLPPIPLQKRFSAPISREIRYPANESDSLSNRTIATFGWLTAPLIDQEEVLALTVLDSVLMETDVSLLKRALLESKLCVQADAYMDTEMSEVPFAIVCKGCDPQNLDKLEKVLFKTLEEICTQGIPADKIEAAIHQLELSRMEITGDHSPFGLVLFMRSALAKQHGGEPEHALTIYTLFESLRKKIQDPQYLTGLIRKFFLDNPHLVKLVLHPDAKLMSEENAEEKQKLKEIQSRLTETDIQKILKQTQELSLYQKRTEEQSIDCLPKVTLADAPALVRDFHLKHHRHGALDVFHADCFTNHILYADLVFDLPDISDEDLPYVHLLMSLLSEVGSGTRDYADNLDYIHAHTGGIGATAALHLQTQDPNLTRPCVTVRGKALTRKADKLLPLLRDTILHPRYDEASRIEELMLQLYDGLQNRFSRQAMRYAIQLSLSGSSIAGHVSEAWYGLRYFNTIQAISKNLSQNLPKLIDKLLILKEKIFTAHQPHLVLSCDTETLHQLQAQDFYGLSDLPTLPFTPFKGAYPLVPSHSQGRAIASQVAFCAQAFKTIPYLHPHAPALLAATHLFENKVLHRKVREQGGAYGVGATYNSTAGHFYFHSYRDPHIARTQSTFHEALETISQGKFSEQDLEEAKLGLIQQFDTPISPGNRALTAYSWWRDGKTKEMRQEFRDRLISLTPKQIEHTVTNDLLPKEKDAVFVVFAGKELLEKENALLSTENKALPILTDS